MKRLVRGVYGPVFLTGFVGWGLYQPQCLLLVFAAALAVSFLMEQWLPYEPQWNRSLGDRRRDTLHALVNESLNALGLLILPWQLAQLCVQRVEARLSIGQQALQGLSLKEGRLGVQHQHVALGLEEGVGLS